MITIVYGTRPELIKLYPVILELKKKKLKHKIIFSGQHTILVNNIIKKLKIYNDNYEIINYYNNNNKVRRPLNMSMNIKKIQKKIKMPSFKSVINRLINEYDKSI